MARQETLLATLICILAGVVFVFPIFQYPGNWGIQDWDEHFFKHAVPRVTILDYHQIPLWNPYYCGGTVMLAHPESRILTPFFLLHLLLGTTLAIKIEIASHLSLGMLGTYLLARRLFLDRLTAWLPPMLFMLSSMFAVNLAVGMTWFLSVAFIPWVFFFLNRQPESWTDWWAAAFFLVLMYFEGGAYPLSITVLFLCVYSLCELPVFGARRIATRVAVILAFTICLGAVKFVPSIEFLHQYPRKLSDYSGYSLTSLGYSWFNRDQTIEAVDTLTSERGFLRGISYGMDENGMYLGVLPTLLLVLGLLVQSRKHWRLVVCFVLFLWLSFGSRLTPSLWQLLHTFPIYDSMRVAQRYRVVALLCIALLAGFGLQELRRLLSRWMRTTAVRLALGAVLVFVGVDLFLVDLPIWRQAFPISPPSVGRVDRGRFYQVASLPPYDASGWIQRIHNHSAWSSQYPALLSNVGVVDGRESAKVPRRAIPRESANYAGEVFLRGTSGEAGFSEWTPNRFRLQVRAEGDGLVVVNQNFYTGWHTTTGRKTLEVDGLLAVPVSPADREIELYYLPVSFIIGAGVSLISLALSVCAFIQSRGRARQFGSTGSPGRAPKR